MQKWRTANREKAREYDRKFYAKDTGKKRANGRQRATGWTPKMFAYALEVQGGKCGLCGKPLDMTNKQTHADHDHDTGLPRALLCNMCNLFEGIFRRANYSLEFASKVVAYVEFYRAQHALMKR